MPAPQGIGFKANELWVIHKGGRGGGWGGVRMCGGPRGAGAAAGVHRTEWQGNLGCNKRITISHCLTVFDEDVRDR